MSDPENIVPPEVGRQPRSCPTCGSEDPEVLGEKCSIPEGVSDRHIPADEFADEWHFQDNDAATQQETP